MDQGNQILRLWVTNMLVALISFELKDVQTALSIVLIIVSIIYTVIKIIKDLKKDKGP